MKKGEDTLARIQRLGHIGDWEWNIKTNAVFWSDELFRIYGFTPQEVTPDYALMLDRLHPDSREEFQSAITAALNDDRHFELDYRLMRQDGSEAFLHGTGEVHRDQNGQPVKMYMIVQDTTESRQAEKALRESEQKFRTIFETAADGLLIVNPETNRFVEANARICRMLGYSREEIGALGIEDIHPAEALSRVMADLERQLQGDLVVSEELPVLRKDGSVFYADVCASPFTLHGQPRALGIFRDITERKLAEDELRKRERQLRESQEVAMIGSWSHDVATDEIEWSDEVFRLFDQDPLTFRTSLDYFVERMHAGDREPVQRAIREAIENDGHYHVQARMKNESGREWKMEAFGRLEKDENGKPVRLAGTAQDITGQSRLQEQLAQSQKIESVGRLAGGVAHDINNALQVIIGNIEIALTEVPGLRQTLGAAQKAAEQSANITQQLLGFARQQIAQPKLLDLNAVVSDFIDLLKRLIGENISLSWKPQAQPASVMVDPTQIYQILTNLCINAGQSIKGTGNIKIVTRNARLDESDCMAHVDFQPGDYVMLEVRDDGGGMKKEVLDHLFEPFFTTRANGLGTGLGLATVHGLVVQNRGLIDVQSKPGQGACFTIYLPLVKNGEAAPEKLPESKPVESNGETVLLVEDELAILDLGARILKKLGYRVICADTPETALQEAREHIEEIDFLVTDVVMPKMNGQELAARISELKPALKCLYMSGYSNDIITRNGVLDTGFNFIQKPFSIEDISSKLRLMADSR